VRATLIWLTASGLAAAVTPVAPTKASPTPAQLCPWIDPAYLHPGQCGHVIAAAPGAPKACAFETPPRMTSSTTVSAGKFTCGGANCTRHAAAQPLAYWLGRHPEATSFTCTNRIRVALFAVWVRLTPPDGKACGPVQPPIPQMDRFVVPASWGGRLQVIWNISTWHDYRPAGYEYETATFSLHGKANGCHLLVSVDTKPVP
jgi:hypothetical protein